MTFSNKDKAEHGYNAKNDLGELLETIKQFGYYDNLSSPFRVGMPGYSNNSQFYAPFAIEFSDKNKWVLFSTTSFRSDRIKENQWDAFNLKRIDPTVKKAFLIYPDSVEEKNKADFKRQQEKYINHVELTEIDYIVSQSEFSILVEEHFLKGKGIGVKKDLQGRNFEKTLATILSNERNFVKWTTGSKLVNGLNYDIYRKILDYLALDMHNLKSIRATADPSEIGKLPSGGNPKTDIIVYAKYSDNPTEKYYSISCKRSSSTKVSVHEYSANTFANVLDKDNSKLRLLLNEFQKYGNLRDFGENNSKALEEELSAYKQKLFFWVMGGYYGDGTEEQKADYIVLKDDNNQQVYIHSIQEYYNLLTSMEHKGHFGTLFSWTFPSGKKGKKIQLKCELIK